MKAYLCGTACLFKSTVLHKMKTRGFKTKPGDYKEACDAYRFFANKTVDPIVSIVYNSYVILNEEDGAVHDRCVIDSIVYDCIFGEKTDAEFEHYMLNFRAVNQKWLDRNQFVFLCSGDDEATLKRMKNRNNGIDKLDIAYVQIQNKYFERAAKLLDKPMMLVSSEKDIDGIVSIVSKIALSVNGVGGGGSGDNQIVADDPL
nr:TMK [Calliteara abietis nucleopolyhedrovirus]